MKIQWFPGHMTKALRMIDDNIALIDGVIYLVDARCPFSCLNPEFAKRIENKPFLFVLNKSDLADEVVTKKWIRFFNDRGSFAIAIDSTKSNASKLVYQAALSMMSDKINKYKTKGVNRAMRFMVVGIPNCGKSTLINNFCGEKRANTGDKPGVTKGKQWIKVDDKVELLDTPGTTYPSFKNETVAANLAFIGSINDDILDVDELALELIKTLISRYSGKLAARFGIEEKDSEAITVFERICAKRGYLLRGNEFDYSRGATAVVDDFRKGRIGRITLETPLDGYVK